MGFLVRDGTHGLVAPHGSILLLPRLITAIEELRRLGRAYTMRGTTDGAMFRGNHAGNYENQ